MTQPQQSSAPSKPQNTWFGKVGYGTGTLAQAVKDLAFGGFVLFYYTSVVGLSGSLAGTVIFISLIWDAVSDPIIGSISDNWRSRWGRRHPLMVFASVPFGICLFALFNVPSGLSETWIFIWMLVFCLGIRTFMTIFQVPHMALGAELSSDYYERSSIAGIRTIMGWFFGVIFSAGAWGLIFSGDGQTDGRLIPGNYVTFGSIGCAIIIFATLWSAAATWKKIPLLPQAEAGNGGFQARRLVSDIVEALQNSNFRFLFLVMLTLGVATGLTASLGTHVFTYFWELSTQQLSIHALAAILPSVVMMALLPYLNRRIEKQKALRWSILGLLLNSIWLVPGRLLGIIPDNDHVIVFPLILLHTNIAIALVIWFQTVSGSFIADITDEQEYLTHRRQEGVFFAAQLFSIKFVTGIGTLLGGVTLDLINMPTNAAPGTVDAQVVFELGIVMGPVMALLIVVPYLFARRITMDHAQHEQIQQALAERQAQSQPSA